MKLTHDACPWTPRSPDTMPPERGSLALSELISELKVLTSASAERERERERAQLHVSELLVSDYV
jgi:hypothetical protein